MNTLLTILVIWTIAQFVLVPFFGRFLKYGGAASDESLMPLPSGSIIDNHPERVS